MESVFRTQNQYNERIKEPGIERRTMHGPFAYKFPMTPTSKIHFPYLVCAFALPFILGCVLSAWGQDIDPQAVKESIDRAITYLKQQQNADGSWKMDGHVNDRCGTTALAVLAMRSCGIAPNDPSIQQAMRYLRTFTAAQAGQNYSLSLQTMAFCAVEPERDRALIRNNIALLERNQNTTNEHSGGWNYTPGGGSDLSNSQFSILALYEAERVGIRINSETWRRTLRYWSQTQNPSGAWGYTPQAGGGSDSSRGSMTCAGIASLIISAGVLEKGGAAVEGDRIICFQKPDSESSEQIKRGIDWLAKEFSVSTNPGAGNYLLYYLYALERVGRMTNQRFIGKHDWYRAGTDKILALQSQDVARDHWQSTGCGIISDTAFALLFLSKGRRPVLMSKIQFGSNDAWNVHPNDVNNLTLFVESKWKLDMTWQIIDIRQATADHLLQSPVISFSAKDWSIPPNEMPILAKKLRDYLDQGGFIIAEAQPGGTSFDSNFRAFMQMVFPEPGYELTLLEKSHPIWTAEQMIDPDHLRPIEGIHYGCRTSVIYIPAVEGKPSLSCLWEVYRHFNRDDTRYADVVQRQIDNGLGIGLNILAYATSRELKGKDEIPEQVVRKETDIDRRGRIFLPFLDYGAMNPAPHAPQNLLYFLEDQCKIRVVHQASSVTLSDESLSDYPVLFMHGRGKLEFSEEQHRRLRAHLERGGFLFANAICSSEPFAVSFQAEMKKVFPHAEWQRIPMSDPIFSDVYGGFKIDTLDIRQPERAPGQSGTVTQTRKVQPELRGIRLSDEDRWLVVFSPSDVSCALENTSSLECRGYSRNSALQLAANVILYAIEHW